MMNSSYLPFFVVVALLTLVIILALLHEEKKPTEFHEIPIRQDANQILPSITSSSSSALPAPQWKPFNTTNPHQSSWCPYARCQNSPLCTPCHRRHILLLSTARSGSTTLLYMLNQLPHIRMAGENNNVLYSEYQLMKSIGKDRSTSILEQNFDLDGPWKHNAIPPQSMACDFQHLLSTLNPPPHSIQERTNSVSLQDYDENTILGVKTIRFQKGKWTAKEAAGFVNEHFPCSRVIINTRSNVEEQALSIRSTFHNQKSQQQVIQKIEKMNRFLHKVGHKLGEDMAKMIDMNQWINDVSLINEVVDWLGYTNCTFQNIVHENNQLEKGDGYGRDQETDTGLGDSCHYPFL